MKSSYHVTWKNVLQPNLLHCIHAPILALLSFPCSSQSEQTLLNLSGGTNANIIGSIVLLLPNLTSGIYNAHTT